MPTRQEAVTFFCNGTKEIHRTADICRPELTWAEVGAVCGKAARTDLCGGRSVMNVPTATNSGAPTHQILAFFGFKLFGISVPSLLKMEVRVPVFRENPFRFAATFVRLPSAVLEILQHRTHSERHYH